MLGVSPEYIVSLQHHSVITWSSCNPNSDSDIHGGCYRGISWVLGVSPVVTGISAGCWVYQLLQGYQLGAGCVTSCYRGISWVLGVPVVTGVSAGCWVCHQLLQGISWVLGIPVVTGVSAGCWVYQLLQGYQLGAGCVTSCYRGISWVLGVPVVTGVSAGCWCVTRVHCNNVSLQHHSVNT